MTDEKPIGEILGWQFIPYPPRVGPSGLPETEAIDGVPRGWWRDPKVDYYVDLPAPPSVEDMLDWLLGRVNNVRINLNGITRKVYVDVFGVTAPDTVSGESVRDAVEAAVRKVDEPGWR